MNNDETVSVISSVMDVYERLIKAQEWNQYQNKKHNECAESLLQMEDNAKDLQERLDIAAEQNIRFSKEILRMHEDAENMIEQICKCHALLCYIQDYETLSEEAAFAVTQQADELTTVMPMFSNEKI